MPHLDAPERKLIKLVYCLVRRPTLTRDQFLDTWLNEHAPLVKAYSAAINATSYTQNHTFQSGYEKAFAGSRNITTGCEFDGVTEITWDDMAAFEKGLQSKAGLKAGKALLEDEQRFLDLPKCQIFLTRPHVIF